MTIRDLFDAGAPHSPAGFAAWGEAISDRADASVRPPAIIIAAADAPDEVKAAADVVCDGVDDNVEIQAALDAGRPVVLSEGTFWINGEVGQRLTLPSNAVLRGQGPQQTVVALQPMDLSEANLNPLLSWGVIMTADDSENLTFDVTIADLTVDGNHRNMLVEGNGNQAEGVNIKYARRFKITNVHVFDCNADGFDIDLSSGVMTNVSALNCRGNGIHLSGGFPAGADETASRWVVVQGADIEGCGYGFLRGAFDVTEDSAYCVYQGITTRGNRAIGTIAGNYNTITDLISVGDDNGLTISGDHNALTGASLRPEGLQPCLAVSGNHNVIANVEARGGSRAFAVNNAGNTLSNVNEGAALVPSDVASAATDTRIVGCFFALTPGVAATAQRTQFVGCRTTSGAASENRGTATIPDGETSVDIAHGLWATPVAVTATPRAVDQVAVTARDADTITISRAGTSGDLDVDWAAHV